MAIIYTYPTKSNPSSDDLILISDSADSNKTKQVKVSSLPSSGGGSVTSVGFALSSLAALAVTGDNPVTGTGTITLGINGNPSSGYLDYQGNWSTPTNTQYTVEPPILLNGTVISLALRSNAGLVITNNELALNLAASSIGGALAISNGGTGATSLPSTITNSTVNYSSDGTGSLPVAKGGTGSSSTTFCNLTSNVTGILPVANGGTGLSTVSAGLIPRGNATGAFVVDSYFQYEGTSKSLRIRGTGNTSPSLSCTLGINDAQGPGSKIACIGLTPTGAQGAKGIHIDLGAYNAGMQINRNSALTGVAIQFQQTVSGDTGIGSISMTNSATAYNTSSDYRLKENVVDMTGSVDRVKQLKPKRFNFTVDPGITVDGFLAHEAQSIVPESVTGSKDEVDENGKEVYQGIDQAKLVPLLVGAIKELTARIEALEG